MTIELGAERPLMLSRGGRTRVRAPLRAYRLVEVVLAAGAIALFLPLLLLIALLIKVFDPGPVLYRQQRLGFGGRLFACFKFRSMVCDADQRLEALLDRDPIARREWDTTRKLSRDPRVTALGGFLRRSSFDELPQLWNVLRGDMSLVGPRPIIPDEIPFYGRYIRDYCQVRPGISGLWQISGRSDTTYRRRVACDVLYVRRKSFELDMTITLRTIPAILTARGAR